ncbi:MAG: tyrosine-type recombinase/integrase [Candidatus Gastranaerophilales bacterium]|nr:tyrosine-type recombinase/integrase [Candidatus Gastranaerophilales bacterium]
MHNKILTAAKKLKKFTIDDIVMFTDIECDIAESILANLVDIGKIENSNKNYVYIGAIQTLDNFEIIETKFHQKESKNHILFFESFEYFIKNYAKKNCTVSTIKGYNSLFKNHLAPYFKNIKLSDLTVEDIKKYIIFCKNSDLKQGLIKNSVMFLNQLIRYHQEVGTIDKKCVFQVKRFKTKRKPVKILPPVQVIYMLQICKEKFKKLYPIIFLALKIGMKKSEILALTKNDLDFENKIISINKTLYKNTLQELRFEKQKRQIHVDDGIMELLKKYVFKHKTLLFVRDKYSKEMEQKRLREKFAQVKADLNLEDFVFDDLRHTFAYNFLKSGRNIETLYKQLGDYSIQSTMEKYGEFI